MEDYEDKNFFSGIMCTITPGARVKKVKFWFHVHF